MSQDRDYLLALEMQNKWNNAASDDDLEVIPKSSPLKKRKQAPIANGKYRSNLDDDYLNRTSNLVHPQWETLDPTPDTQSMFKAFDDKFFQRRLRCVTLEWSKRMYSCAGICYSRRNHMGMSITIRLSEPLLKLRSRKDLVETMLHEMIHAYAFVLGIREGNGGHGPNFKKMMHGINQVAGTNITVYHTFHDEVNVYKTHWWRCNGSCQHRSPFYGYVKRTSNRAPGPNDIWWSQHLHSCGGTFMKIKEPEKSEKKTKSKPKAISANAVKAIKPPPKAPSGADLRTFFPSNKTRGPVKTNGGGTLLLNPKTVRTTTETTSETPLPKVSEPKRAPSGNLKNVIGFKDLGNDDSPRTNTTPVAVRDFSMTGKGYSLSNTGNSELVDLPVDKNHLRDVWLKRFGGTSNNTPKQSQVMENDVDIAGNAKRRRLSTQCDKDVTYVADEIPAASDWVAIDDDIMVHEGEKGVIDISSSDDESDFSQNNTSTPRKAMVFADADARHKQIKKEILDDSGDLLDGEEGDIVLIDDEYNDDAINTSIELADTSLVDDLFGDDTLLKDFKRENDVAPSCSNYSNDPRKDIITCPICQEKMKRENFSDHLDGCVGITKKIEYGKKKPKPKAITPKKTSKPSTSRTREILLSAGYTEEDLKNITAESNDVTLRQSSDDLNLSERMQRSQNLYTPTRTCPVCCSEVEVDKINEHLDECLSP